MGLIALAAPCMRRPRLELPGIPMHITHRGVNRAATFIDDGDCAAYLQALEVAAHRESVAIHAYVLMTNHVHLLVGADLPGAVSRMMQLLGRATFAPSMPGMAVPEHCGKDVANHAWWAMAATSLHACATSN